MNLNAQLPAYAKGLFRHARYKVFYGGRGAGRSWSFARALLIKGAQKELRILCCREFQKSIADSVHKLLTDQIQMMGMPGWKISKTDIVHAGTGTRFIFEGLRYNTNRIKSLEGIDICWVEEAESVSKDSWEILIPTIRKEGSEIWISFNPDLEDDPTYQRFVVHQPPNAIVQKIGWQDNPWFNDTEMPDERDYLYRVDPEAAEHVWGGYPKKSSEAQILHGKWKVEAFEPMEHWLGPFYGSDFGFAEDPTTMVELYIAKDPGKPKVSQGRLMVRRESWKVKLDTHKIIPLWHSVFGKTVGQRVVRADSARPETISYLKQHGMRRIRPVFKWSGSVEDGIAYLRQFEEIVIHPDCPHFKEEAKLYSYKVDKKTGDILRDVEDRHNHLIDATRYALAPMIRARRTPQNNYSGMSYSSNG